MDRITNWLCSMLFLLISLSFPFLIAMQYNEQIPIKTINIAIGMYLLTIATTARNLFFFFFLLVFAMYTFTSYGAYKADEYFEFYKEILSVKGFIVIVATAIAAIEKWNYHVIQEEPFLPFHKSFKKRF